MTHHDLPPRVIDKILAFKMMCSRLDIALLDRCLHAYGQSAVDGTKRVDAKSATLGSSKCVLNALTSHVGLVGLSHRR